MEQMIVRILPGISDVEVLLSDDNNYLTCIKGNDFIKMLMEYFGTVEMDEFKLDLTDSNIIFYKSRNNHQFVYYKFDERILHPTYQNKIFKHMHPNTIFILDIYQKKIYNMKAFIFKKWKKLDTVLFHYDMPNMLGSNNLCIGTINKVIEDTYLNTILKFIEGNYTSSIEKIKNKLQYDYDKCVPLNYTLRKIVEG